MDRHKQINIVEDHTKFLKKIEKLKPYIIEFFENGIRKSKIYPFNCIVRGENCQPLIIITHDKCTFFANDEI